ncbi:MAG TPA: Crp/Fnr family transcriptional regulator, partial [Rhizomicrobium sp.]
MSAVRKSKNGILSGLSHGDAALLSPFLTAVDLPVRKQLETRNRRIEHVYFLDAGIASMVASAGTNHSIEIGMIGSEGMTGLSVVMGTDRSPHEIFMQSGGHGWRIASADLVQAMAASPALRDGLLRYSHTLMTQMGYTALSNGRYKLEERLARWLLMAHDRSSGGDVLLTHEFLAVMLGTRRPGITAALSEMEKGSVIGTRRGSITV